MFRRLLVASYWVIRSTFEKTVLSTSVFLLRPQPSASRLEVPKHGLHFARSLDGRFILWVTKVMCYAGKDLRAAWLVDGLPMTSRTEYEPLAKWAREHWAMYFSFIDRYHPAGHILDFGCGIGNMTANLALALPSSSVTGLDLNAQGIQIGRSRFNGSNLSLKCGDALTPSFSQEYDFAFCIEVLEHVSPDQHDQLIFAAMNVLRPGGLLFLTTPNALQEEDHEWGHIGMLNSRRAPDFFKRFAPMVKDFGYLDNQKLESGNVEDFLKTGSIEEVQSGLLPNYSHFWVVLQKDGGSSLEQTDDLAGR